MKKQLLSILVLGLFTTSLLAQSPRLSLYEHFTSETCPPDAFANPGLQIKLDSMVSKIIAISWHVPIPSAPTPSWSPYQANKIENNWRFMCTGGYSYTSQYTPTNVANCGINSSPTCLIDGQHQWVFGASSDHSSNLTYNTINTSQAIPSPFTIGMLRSWDATYSSVNVTISITASQNYTAIGSLVYRLVMVEKEIHFTTAPGTNGEKDFYNTARASFPNIQNGTALSSTWTTGQNITFTLNCPIPSNIIDKSMVDFVGFIQDDGNKKVMQAATTGTAGVLNDAAAIAIIGPMYSCGTTYSPVVVIKNNGLNTITGMTITPIVDGIVGATFFYPSNLLAGGSATITAPVVTTTNGLHTYSINISGVSGTDYNLANNVKQIPFILISSYFPVPITEAFTPITFPPANWFMLNANQGPATWSRIPNTGGYAVGLGCAKYDFYNNNVLGDADDLFLPSMDFTGISSPLLTFDIAYCQYSAELDKLEVLVSVNCGATWANVYSKAGAVLSGTNSPQTAQFAAQLASNWRTEVVNLSAFANQAQVLIKFVATSDYGNNLFLDNINLSNTANIKTETIFSSVELYPNPAKTFSTIDIELSQNENLSVSVMNELGQIIFTQAPQNFETGSHQLKLNTENWSSGIYNVVISGNAVSLNRKLTVSR